MNKINLPLEFYNINGVIHVGGGAGEYAKYYYDLGVYQVVWTEENNELYNKLYQNTSFFGMKQNYYITKLSDEDILNNNTLTFKTLWKKHPYDIDIETYDALVITENNNPVKIIEGFKEFKNIFNIIVSFETNSEIENYMNEIGYELITYTNHFLYKRK